MSEAVKEEKPWACSECGASCTYEAMTQCAQRWDRTAVCGYDRDKPRAYVRDGVSFEFYTVDE